MDLLQLDAYILFLNHVTICLKATGMPPAIQARIRGKRGLHGNRSYLLSNAITKNITKLLSMEKCCNDLVSWDENSLAERNDRVQQKSCGLVVDAIACWYRTCVQT